MPHDEPLESPLTPPRTASRSSSGPGGAAQATRRRFLLGGLGTLAGVGGLALLNGPSAGAAETDAVADASSSSGGSSASGSADATTATDATGSEASASGLVPYRKRSAWGAYEPYRYADDGSELFPPVFEEIQKVTIHHTGTWSPADEDEAVELIRNIYHEHAVIQGMGDIGYHLLIAPDGTVYEGRWSGGTHFPIYDIRPGTWGRAPMAVTGAHTQYYNSGNIGIALMGDFDEEDPSDEALWSLQVVTGLIMANTGIDPLGRGRYVNPISGATITVPNVCIHHDFIDTECPGAALADAWSTIRAGAASEADQLAASSWIA
jgi:hypothetical protein